MKKLVQSPNLEQLLGFRIYQRPNSDVWWVRFSHQGRQLRFTTGETDRKRAQVVAATIVRNPDSALAKLKHRKVDKILERADTKGLILRGNIWWVRFNIDGQRYSFSTGETDKVEALLEAERLRKNPPIEAHNGLVTEAKAFAATKSFNYARSALPVLLRFIDFLDSPDPRLITAEKIQKWLIRQQNIKPNTREGYRFYIKRFLDYLIEQRKVRRNSATEVVIATEARSTRKRWIHRRDYPKIFAAAEHDLELKFVLYCGLHAGLRKEEAIMFRPEWIDREIGSFGVIHITFAPDWRPKDGTERTIPLSEEFRQFLDHGFPRLPGPYMIAPFRMKKPGTQYRVDFRTKFENLVGKLDLGHFTFHDCRRSFASNLVSGGESLYKVAKWLGDDPDIVASTYGHLDPDDTGVARVFARPQPPPPPGLHVLPDPETNVTIGQQ